MLCTLKGKTLNVFNLRPCFSAPVYHYFSIKDKAEREQRALVQDQEMGENLALQWHHFLLAQPKLWLNKVQRWITFSLGDNFNYFVTSLNYLYYNFPYN